MNCPPSAAPPARPLKAGRRSGRASDPEPTSGAGPTGPGRRRSASTPSTPADGEAAVRPRRSTDRPRADEPPRRKIAMSTSQSRTVRDCRRPVPSAMRAGAEHGWPLRALQRGVARSRESGATTSSLTVCVGRAASTDLSRSARRPRDRRAVVRAPDEPAAGGGHAVGHDRCSLTDQALRRPRRGAATSRLPASPGPSPASWVPTAPANRRP